MRLCGAVDGCSCACSECLSVCELCGQAGVQVYTYTAVEVYMQYRCVLYTSSASLLIDLGTGSCNSLTSLSCWTQPNVLPLTKILKPTI